MLGEECLCHGVPLLVESTVQAHPATFALRVEWCAVCIASAGVVVAGVGVDVTRPLAQGAALVALHGVAIFIVAAEHPVRRPKWAGLAVGDSAGEAAYVPRVRCAVSFGEFVECAIDIIWI